MKLHRMKQFKWSGQLNPCLYFFYCFIRLLHGTAILAASVTWYFKMSGELLRTDVCRLPITFLLSLTPLLPTVGPVCPCHFVPLAVGLLEQPLAVGSPPLDTSMVSSGASLPHPGLAFEPADKSHHLPHQHQLQGPATSQEWCRKRGQVLLLGVSPQTSPSIALNHSR